jgi:hypothetical protein
MKRTTAVVFAVASLAWTLVWAGYVFYLGLTDWVPDNSDGDSSSYALAVTLLVTLVPATAALAGLFGSVSSRGIFVWVAASILALFFFSPGLFGLPYAVSALLMFVAAFRASATCEDSSPAT